MKLASYDDGSRDGQLLVVSRDLATAQAANGIATRLQQVLDDWNFLSPQLEDLYTALNQGRARHAFAFDPARCAAPLPRTHQRAVALATPPAAGGAGGVRLVQRAGDALLGPRQPLVCGPGQAGVAVAAGFAAATGDVPRGADAHRALDGVRLLLLAAEVGVVTGDEAPDPRDDACAAGCLFAPVAVTPDELGEAWHDGRVQATLRAWHNGRGIDGGDDGAAGEIPFGELLARLACARALGAGSLVGARPVPAGHGRVLAVGDSLRLDVQLAPGRSLFGTIEISVVAGDDRPPG